MEASLGIFKFILLTNQIIGSDGFGLIGSIYSLRFSVYAII